MADSHHEMLPKGLGYNKNVYPRPTTLAKKIFAVFLGVMGLTCFIKQVKKLYLI